MLFRPIGKWLSRKPRASRPIRIAPRLGCYLDRGGLEELEPRAMPAIGISFLGPQLSEAGFIPPDSTGDVSNTQILVAANGRIKVFDKAGNLGGLNASANTFFNSVRNGGSPSDPHIRFDRLSGRWFVTAITTSTPNRVMIAVSNSSTVTGVSSFSFFQFQQDLVGATPNVDTNNFADYDTLGVDKFALYVGVVMFNPSFYGGTGFVINKADLINGTLTVTAFRQIGTGTTGIYVPQGVNNDDPNATEGYFVGTDANVFSKLNIQRVINPGSATPTISGNLGITVSSTTFPITQVAKSSTRPLDGLDDRLFAAMIHRDKITNTVSLWTAHNFQVNSSGAASSSGARNGSRWYQIGNLTGTPSLIQSGTVFDSAASNPRGYWIPSIAMNGEGNAYLASSMASTNDFAGIAAAQRFATDTLGTMQAPVIALASASAYNVQTSGTQRWGDYSQTVVDPADDMTMWTFQEYCNAANSWGVRVIQLTAPLPATPSSASASVKQGDANVNITVTGTSSGGSWFFDPGADSGGPGYINHIAASVGGSGVTVNSVTFSDPTHIILSLTVSASAAIGTRTITVTNPDGQSTASASGILTIESGSNSPPVLSGIDSADLAYTENDGGKQITAALTVTDSNDTNLAGATISITSGFVSAEDELLFTDQNGISGSYNSGTGVLTLSGSSSVANYQTALRAVQYRNISDNPDTTARTITFQATDGTASSNTQLRNVAITAVNDAPINTVPSGTLAPTEDTAFSIAGLAVSDLDAGSANIQITLGVTKGKLTVRTDVSGGLAAGDVSGNGTVAVVLTASQAKINATLSAANGVVYLGNANFSGTDTLTLTTDDLGHSPGPAKTDSDTVNLNMIAVADAVNVTSPANGNEGAAIDLTLSLQDTDNSEVFRIGGVPTSGVTFNKGTDKGSGVWEFTNAQLTGLTITVADGPATLNLTARSRETSNDDLGPSQTLTVNVANLPPTQPTDDDSASNTIAENASDGDTVGVTAKSTDIANDTITYVLTNSAGGRFAINATTGVVTVADASLLDGGAAQTITVRADDEDGGQSATKDFTISVTNVAPTQPSDDDSASNTVAENAANGATVGVAAKSTDIANDTITYVLTNSAGGRFKIDGKTGVVTVADASLLDGAATHTITVRADDEDGGQSATKDFTISVTNVAPTQPSDDDSASNTVAENVANGATVGVTAKSTDVANDTITYVLTNSAGGRFAINATTGVVTVADASLLDGGATQTITVRADDEDGGQSATKDFTITVTNVAPTQPTDNDSASNTVPENAANGVTMGVTAKSVDVTGDTITYVLTNSAGGRFAINSITGVVTVANGSLLDGPATFSIIVRADDEDGGQSITQNFTITVANIAPTITISGNNGVNEGQSYTLNLGAISDPGADTVTQWIVHWGDGSFDMFTAAGNHTHTYADGPNTCNITVDLTDEDGVFLNRANPLSVSVVNVAPTQPTDINNATNTVAENAINGTAVGITAQSTDVIGDKINFVLTNNAGGRFAINGLTGIVTVANNLLLDGPSTHTIAMRADDEDGGQSATQDFTITVTNVAPTQPIDFDGNPNTVAENASNGATVGVTARSTDVGGDSISYVLTNSVGGRFVIDGTTGVVTVADAALLDGPTTYTITVRANDEDGGQSATRDFTITVANVAPTQPTDLDDTANTIMENASNGTTVGVTVGSTDITNDTVSYVLTNDAGGRFAVNSATGVVTVANASLLDGQTMQAITVRADDEDGGQSFTQDFDIVVTNLAPTQPVDNDGNPNTVAEGAANGTAVGITAKSSDIANDTITYVLTNNAGGRYAIISSTGVVTVANASLLDGPATHTITVRADDEDVGKSATANFTIAVTNVNPTASFTNNGPRRENQTVTFAFSSQFDPSAADTSAGFTYFYDFNGDGDFTDPGDINGTPAASAAIKFPHEGDYTVRGRIRDKDNGFTDYSTTATVTNVDVVAIAPGPGTAPLVKLIDAPTLATKFTVMAFDPAFRGGVTAATGDVNGDGIMDLVVGMLSRGRTVKVFDGSNGLEITARQFDAFPGTTADGVFVAAGDVNGDGYADIVVGPGARGKTNVRVISGFNGSQLKSFTSFSISNTAGVRVATGDVDGDGKADVIAALTSGIPQVKIFNVSTPAANPPLIKSFNAFAANSTGGLFVAAGDLNGDGKAEVIASQDRVIRPKARVINGLTGVLIQEFEPFAGSLPTSARVSVTDRDGDGLLDIVTATGTGVPGKVRFFKGTTRALIDEVLQDPGFMGGIFVG